MRIYVLASLALLAACSRSPDHTATAADSAAAARTATTERVALFGSAATDPLVTWRDRGLGIKVERSGAERKPGIGDTVRLRYVGRLRDGTIFDRADKPVDFQIGRTVAGLSTGLQAFGAGGKGTVFIPPALGYGARKVAGIPPNSALIFDVEVDAINP